MATSSSRLRGCRPRRARCARARPSSRRKSISCARLAMPTCAICSAPRNASTASGWSLTRSDWSGRGFAKRKRRAHRPRNPLPMAQDIRHQTPARKTSLSSANRQNLGRHPRRRRPHRTWSGYRSWRRLRGNGRTSSRLSVQSTSLRHRSSTSSRSW